MGVDTDAGTARARFLGLSTDLISFDIPSDGLPEWAAAPGTLARVRVTFDGDSLVLANIDRLELQMTPDEVEAELDGLVPPDNGIVAG